MLYYIGALASDKLSKYAQTGMKLKLLQTIISLLSGLGQTDSIRKGHQIGFTHLTNGQFWPGTASDCYEKWQSLIQVKWAALHLGKWLAALSFLLV